MYRDPKLPELPFSLWQRAAYNGFQVLDHFISRPLTVKLFGKLRYRLFESISRSLRERGEGKLIEVDRRRDLGVAEFKRDYLQKGIPVVLEGAAKDWPCCQTWNPDFIKESYGDDEVPLLDHIYFEQGLRYVKLASLIDEMLEGKNSYFRFYNLLARHPERYADFDNEWLKSMRHKRCYADFFQVFIGGANSMTGMHNAHADNLFVQVYGEKHWVLYPNYFVPLIDPPSTTSGTHRLGPRRGEERKPFNPFLPDFDTYPLYKHIDGYKVSLKPGDVFYNPPYMWHSVMNSSTSIGIGYRWINAASAFKASPLYYLLDLCAYRPSYFKAYKWYKKDSNAEFVYAQKMLQKHLAKKARKEAAKAR